MRDGDRHTREARDAGIPFMADPSQQLASLDGEAIADLVSGARFLVTNDYEWALIQSKTGWSHDELVSRAEVSITTHGPEGCVVEAGAHNLTGPVVRPRAAARIARFPIMAARKGPAFRSPGIQVLWSG